MSSIKETWLKLWNKINKPHGAWLVVFYFAFIVIIASTLTLVFLGHTQNVFSYFMYVIAALSLTYFVYTIVYFAPSMKTAFIQFLKKYKFTNTLLENYGYRTIVFSIITFILNVSYVAFMVVMTVLSRSAWYFSLTIYYIALTMLKGNVFYSKKKLSFIRIIYNLSWPYGNIIRIKIERTCIYFFKSTCNTSAFYHFF